MKPLDPQLQQRIETQSNRRLVDKVKKLLLLLGVFCLVFYGYLVMDPWGRPTPPMIDDLQGKEKCLQSFRLNNCSLDRPSGKTCLELYSCIKGNENRLWASSDKMEKKVMAVEEALENLLLLLGGMGITGVLTKGISNIRAVIAWLKIAWISFS